MNHYFIDSRLCCLEYLEMLRDFDTYVSIFLKGSDNIGSESSFFEVVFKD